MNERKLTWLIDIHISMDNNAITLHGILFSFHDQRTYIDSEFVGLVLATSPIHPLYSHRVGIPNSGYRSHGSRPKGMHPTW
jgi:hypothetical protein